MIYAPNDITQGKSPGHASLASMIAIFAPDPPTAPNATKLSTFGE